jgi:hypothetical protein
MALWWMDSVDGYSSAWVASRYTTFGTAPTVVNNGRTGLNALNFNTPGTGALSYLGVKGVSIPATAPITLYYGGAILIPNGFFANASQYITVYQLPQWGGANGIACRIYGDGSMQSAFAGAFAPAGSFGFGAYHYVEMAAINGASNFETTIWVDDVQVADGTVATPQSVTITTVLFGIIVVGASAGNPNGTIQIDDFHFYDSSGAFYNARSGDVDIFIEPPNGPGRVTGLFSNNAGGGSQNWQNVDEIPPDSDTSYIYDQNAGDEECFTVTPPGALAGASILGQQVTLVAKKATATGTRQIAGGLGNGSAEAFGTPVSLGTAYAMYSFPFSNDPVSGGAFDPTISYQAAVEITT